MFRNALFISLLTITMLLVCNYSYANAGTPLIWAWGFHLYFINIIIAIIESLLLWKLFSANKLLIVIPIMILANFVSMLCGYFSTSILFPTLIVNAVNETIFAIKQIIITYFETIIIEFLFIWFILRNKYNLLKILYIDLGINSATYLIVIWNYYYFLKVF